MYTCTQLWRMCGFLSLSQQIWVCLLFFPLLCNFSLSIFPILSSCLSLSLTYSALGVHEHLYYEAILNNRSVAPCDRRTGLRGNMHIHKCLHANTRGERGTLLEGSKLLFLTLPLFCSFICGVHRSSPENVITALPQHRLQNLQKACVLFSANCRAAESVCSFWASSFVTIFLHCLGFLQ